MDRMCKSYTSPFRFWAGTDLILMVHDAEDIDTILKSPHCLDRMYVYDFLREGISPTSDGLFTANGKHLSEW